MPKVWGFMYHDDIVGICSPSIGAATALLHDKGFIAADTTWKDKTLKEHFGDDYADEVAAFSGDDFFTLVIINLDLTFFESDFYGTLI